VAASCRGRVGGIGQLDPEGRLVGRIGRPELQHELVELCRPVERDRAGGGIGCAQRVLGASGVVSRRQKVGRQQLGIRGSRALQRDGEALARRGRCLGRSEHRLRTRS
jgi:hypothetical protein